MRTGVIAKILNVFGQAINPATEEKQDEIITAINNSGSPIYLKMIDDVAPITYIGEAVRGTATSDAKWRIKRIDETNDPDVTIKWASTDFDQIWDNRTTLTYA